MGVTPREVKVIIKAQKILRRESDRENKKGCRNWLKKLFGKKK